MSSKEISIEESRSETYSLLSGTHSVDQVSDEEQDFLFKNNNHSNSRTAIRSVRRHQVLAALVWIATLLFSGYLGFTLSGNRSSRTAVLDNSDLLVWSTGTVVHQQFLSSFDGTALREVCQSQSWPSGRYFTCLDIEGGSSNVRSAVLNCIRFSLASGSALILPILRVRGEVGLSEEFLHSGGVAGIGHLFDLDYFRQVFDEFCPEMNIYDSLESIPDKNPHFTEPMNPKTIYTLSTGKLNNKEMLNLHADTFREDFDKAMEEYPILVFRTSWPLLFQWPVDADSFAFSQNFNQILQYHLDGKQLASQILAGLRALTPKYLAVHLRAELDVLTLGNWPSPEVQYENYIRMAIESGLKVMYVGGGDLVSVQTLARLAVSSKIQVVSKWDFLPFISLTYFNSLPFDEQAAVDFLILLASDKFVGLAVSSFATSIAISRHKRYNDTSLFPPTGDDYSELLEPHHVPKFVASIWP